MALKDKMNLKEQLRSVIEWADPDPEMLFVRWTESGAELKNASKLIIGPGQGGIFVYEGKVEATIVDEGVVELATDNIPFWTTITKFMQNFESEHKVGIYFFRTAHVVNRRWGTPSPIKYNDPVYKFPVGLGAFGNYSVRITEPTAFFRNVVTGVAEYPIMELQKLFLSRITQPMSDFLAKSAFSFAEIDAHREEIAAAVTDGVRSIFTDLGFELLDFRIEGTNFDEATEGRIAKISDMSSDAQAAAAAGIDYAQWQQLQAMRDMAKNEGMGGLGMQMGMGMGLGKMFGQQMGDSLGGQEKKEGEAAKTEEAAKVEKVEETPKADDPMAKLKKLKDMFDGGLIDEDEYKTKKADILKDM